jgi:hypothetical protein
MDRWRDEELARVAEQDVVADAGLVEGADADEVLADAGLRPGLGLAPADEELDVAGAWHRAEAGLPAGTSRRRA